MGAGKKSDRLTQRTRKLIRDALVAVCAQDKNTTVQNVTITQICNQAGIARSTFYAHYEGVHSLVKEIEDEVVEGINTVYRNFYHEPLNKYKEHAPFPAINELYEFYLGYVDLLRVLLGRNGSPHFVNTLLGMMKSRFLNKLEHDRVECEDADIVSEFVSSGYMGVLEHWVFNRNEVPPEKVSAIVGKLAYGAYYDFGE